MERATRPRVGFTIHRRAGSPLREVDDGYRTLGVVEDLSTYRAEQDSAYQALLVGADDDQLGVLGLAEDRFGGAAQSSAVPLCPEPSIPTTIRPVI